MSEVMTKEEYISIGGSKCPCCSSSNIQTDDGIQVDGGHAWQDIYCDDCDARWQDIWVLAGFEVSK